MGSRYEAKIKEGARPFLEDGEEVLAAIVARPRGWTASVAGHAGPGNVAASMGRRKQAGNVAAADDAGFALASPMALAVTGSRLLSIEIGSPIGLGIGGKVKQLAGSAPLADVDSIEIKRLAAGKTVTVTVRGTPFALEANATADAKGLVAEFERAKSGQTA
ncbi:MAG: hypothetical protein QOE65_359 [Solirubrobacteraceae bacterium]|jgi:hypothetical protein|nr:hypothetical protein [Solirubrobacteraceae bacterium]